MLTLQDTAVPLDFLWGTKTLWSEVERISSSVVVVAVLKNKLMFRAQLAIPSRPQLSQPLTSSHSYIINSH